MKQIRLFKYQGRLVLVNEAGGYQIYEPEHGTYDMSHPTGWNQVQDAVFETVNAAKKAIAHTNAGCCAYGLTEGFGGRKIRCTAALPRKKPAANPPGPMDDLDDPDDLDLEMEETLAEMAKEMGDDG